jgi:hypothetical protein
MERIRILFYTDLYHRDNPSLDFTLEPANPFVSRLGLAMLRDLIMENKPVTAQVEVSLVNRNNPCHAAQKLTSRLLRDYDELWIFGYYEADYDAPEFDPIYGGPHNELDLSEVAALKEWMEKGGILITGDHARDRQAEHDPDLPDKLSLGRALGHSIPRAGKMRKWEGPAGDIPTADRSNSFNTNSPGLLVELDKEELETDGGPQHIYLLSDTSAPYHPHPLFRRGPLKRLLPYKIQVFPDHMHEGLLITPEVSDLNEWPTGSLKPKVIAWGFDHRFAEPTFKPLVSAYEGVSGKAGRIAADSTWHHYTNFNLVCLQKSGCGCHSCSESGGALDQVGAYYGNLVRWLAPEQTRNNMKLLSLPWVVAHPRVAEEIRDLDSASDWEAIKLCLAIGQTAMRVIDTHFSLDEKLELLQMISHQVLFNLPQTLFTLVHELILGSVIKNCYKNNLQRSMFSGEDLTSELLNEAVNEGIREALQSYSRAINEQAKDIDAALKSLNDARFDRDSGGSVEETPKISGDEPVEE